MLILVASLLPALHTLEHFYMDSEIDFEKTEASSELLTESTFDCDLCDYPFSSTNAPTIFGYSLCSPETEKSHISFSQQNIPLSFLAYFSLRAPPAAII